MPRLLVLFTSAIAIWVALLPSQIGAQPVDPLIIRFLDVGRGDATWITTVDKRTVLIDCGGAQFGPQLVVQLQTAHVGRISQLAISQPHQELVGGCVDVLTAVPVDQVSWNGHQDTSAAWQALWSLLAVPPMPLKGDLLSSGSSPTYGPVTATLLNPLDTGQLSNDAADDGLALMINYAGHRVLILGQISDAAAARIASASPGKVDVLKVGNSGLSGDSSQALIDATQPTSVVVSTSAVNPLDKDTVGRLTSRGAKLLTTADHGTVTVYMTDPMAPPTTER
jgi:beta-lactamase superfamily II metal-dependent hydrolase